MGRRKRFVLILLVVPLLILTSALERAGWKVTQFVSRVAGRGPEETRIHEEWALSSVVEKLPPCGEPMR